MKPFSNRYIPERLVAPLSNGNLYIGKDAALKRLVFIYEIPFQGETGMSGAIASLSKASHGLNQPEFMHVLDVEVGEDQLRAILNYKEGRPLRDFIQEHPLSFKEAASMVADFGAALLDTAEQRTLDFSLEAGNLWVTEEMRINVIDTWNAPMFKERLVKHLSGLLYQLVVGSLVVPAEAATFSAQLRQSMRYVPSPLKETTITALTEGWQEKITAADLVRIISGMQPEIVSGENRTAAPVTAPLPSRKENQFLSSEPRKRQYEDRHENEGDDDEEQQDLTETSAAGGAKGRLFRISKSIWIGGAFVLVGLAVFVGVFSLLLGLTGNKGEEAAPAAPAGKQPSEQQQQQPKQPTVDPNKKQPAPEPVKPPVNTSEPGAAVDVPTLTGLTQGEAEKLAVASGLKYEYFIELSTQPAGTVIRQDLAPNKQVEKGTKVTFWVSKGPASPQ